MPNTGHTKPPTVTVDAAIGRKVKILRVSAGIRQELLALVAQQWGLRWTRSAVAMLEAGRRRLTVGELLLLPHVLTRALHHEPPVTLTDLIPDISEEIALTSQTFLYSPMLKDIIGRGGVMELEESAIDRPSIRQSRLYDEATWKASRSLRVPIATLIKLAQQQWGRSLVEERDSRLGASSKLKLSRAQALRGHVTRQLLAELRPIIARTRKDKTTTTRRKRR
jgi:transcriptional regulator with XRE-family HTH domain